MKTKVCKLAGIFLAFLLLLSCKSGVQTEEEENWIPLFTGPDDDGSMFREALQRGGDIDENECSRVYVQGLTTDANWEIAILFDRRSVRGGDHGRSPFMPRVREVLFRGGHIEMIGDADWPAFVAKQRQLLQEEGFSIETIASFYGDTE